LPKERKFILPNIAIVTDTDTSLPADLAAQHHIRQVPILINFGTEAYKTGVEIDDARLFKRIDREKKLPTTSAPAPGQFAEAFSAAFDEGAVSVICICVSRALSASVQAAEAACELMPGRDITVIDSLGVSMVEGFMALAAAEAAQAGAPKAEILARAQATRDRTHMFAVLPTLKYLAMSGRVGHIAAGLADVLNVQPLLTVRDGKLDLLERVRTRSKAWARMAELTLQAAGDLPVERLALLHVVARAEALEFEKQLRAQRTFPADRIVVELSPGLSVHSGAGLVGVVFVAGH
jgi:DegV family protein with EDD domain